MGSGASVVAAEELAATRSLLLKVKSVPSSQAEYDTRAVFLGRIMASNSNGFVSFISGLPCVHCEVIVYKKNGNTNDFEHLFTQRMTHDFFLSDGASGINPMLINASLHPVTFFGKIQNQLTISASNLEALRSLFAHSGLDISAYPSSDIRFTEEVFELGEQICILGKTERFAVNGLPCLKLSPTNQSDYSERWYKAYKFNSTDQERWKRFLGTSNKYVGSDDPQYMKEIIISPLPSHVAPSTLLIAPPVLQQQQPLYQQQPMMAQQMPVYQQQPMLNQPQMFHQQPMMGQQQMHQIQQMMGQQQMMMGQQQPMYQQPSMYQQHPPVQGQQMYQQPVVYGQPQNYQQQQYPQQGYQQQPQYHQGHQPGYNDGNGQVLHVTHGGGPQQHQAGEISNKAVAGAAIGGAAVGAGIVGLAAYGVPDMNGMGGAMSGVGNFAGSAVGQVGNFAAPAFGQVGDFAGSAAGQVGDVAAPIVGQVGNVLGSAGGALFGALGSLF